MSPARGALPELPAERPATLSGAVEAVVAAWEAQRVLAPRTAEKYAMTLRRFALFAAAHGAASLEKADAELVREFVEALGRDRHGHVLGEAREGTRRVRLSALRALFAAMARAGWLDEDPAAAAVPAQAAPATRRGGPLTDDEAELVLFHAGENPAHARPAITAVLLAGVWSSEAAYLFPEDFDPESGTLNVSGAPGRSDRVVALDDRAARIVAGRLAWLRRDGEEPETLLFAVLPEGDRAHIRIHMAALAALRRAGLGRGDGHTGASLTLVAARRALERTGRIEAAAVAVGRRSLDQVARELGWEWLPEDESRSEGEAL